MNIDTNNKETYILGDLNINLYHNGNYSICKNKTLVSRSVSNDARNYHQFCPMFSLKQIIKSPICITCRNTSVDAYKDALKKVNFPNYELYNDVNEAYSNFFRIIRIVVDNIVPCKTKRVKANTQKWFDGEVLQNMNTREKLFKRSK